MSGTDVTTLELRVISDKIDDANRRLGELEKRSVGAEITTDKLAAAFTRFLGPAALLAASISAINKTVEVTRQFDVLNAQLVTATGSAEGATVAFNELRKFAAETPYDLAQVTTAFTQLVNLGLTPSERALKSYGDTAAAMGKGLGQLVEAVADATVGEFERLKEFGIRSQKEGDTVRFTFRGITTEVANSAAEIEGYLIGLGETNFAGTMQTRMDSLDGALSNFADTWDNLFLTVSEQGVGDVMEEGVRGATEAIQFLTDILASGELYGYIAAIAPLFEGLGQDAAFHIDALVKSISPFETEIAAVGYATQASLGFIRDSFIQLPVNVRAAIQLIVVELATWVSAGAEYAGAFAQALGVEIDVLIRKAEAWGKELADVINPFDGNTFNLSEALAEIEDVEIGSLDTIFDHANKRVAEYRALRMESISAVIAERDAAVASFDEQIAKARELGEQYRANRDAEAAASAGVDGLEQFKADSGDPSVVSSGSGKKKKTKTPKAPKEKVLKEDDLEGALSALYTEEEQMMQSYVRRQEMLNTYYSKKVIDENKFNELTIRNKNKFIKDYEGLEKNQNQMSLANLAAFSSAGSAIMMAAFGENKKVKRAAAWMNVLAGAAQALDLPYPASIAAMGHVMAQGIGLVKGIDDANPGSGGAGVPGAGGVSGVIQPTLDLSKGNSGLNNDAFLSNSVADQSKREINIIVNNPRVSGAAALAEELREAVERNLVPYITVRGV